MEVYLLIDKYVDYHDVFDDTQIQVYANREDVIVELNKRWNDFLSERWRDWLDNDSDDYKSWVNADCYFDLYIIEKNIL